MPVNDHGLETLKKSAEWVDELIKALGMYYKVKDAEAIDVLNLILLAVSDRPPLHFNASTVTTPNIEQTLISETVSAGKTYALKSVRVTCRRDLKYEVYVDSVLAGSGRTGAGNLNDDFIFSSAFNANAGEDIEVKVLASAGPASDVEVYLQAIDF